MFRTPNFSWRLAVGGWRENRNRSARSASCPPPTANRQPPTGQEGFTLAALIVIFTIIAIIVAYTVPTQWSLIMRRERERQTIFLMKQYARGIENWQIKHQGPPVSLEQLQEARQPRMLRGTGKWAMPLTGKEDDWILVPPNAAPLGGVMNQQPQQQQQQGGAPRPPSKLNPEASPKDYVGPFIAVRPNAKGKSLITLNGAEDYSEWVYTVEDLKNERLMQQMALSAK